MPNLHSLIVKKGLETLLALLIPLLSGCSAVTNDVLEPNILNLSAKPQVEVILAKKPDTAKYAVRNLIFEEDTEFLAPSYYCPQNPVVLKRYFLTLDENNKLHLNLNNWKLKVKVRTGGIDECSVGLNYKKRW